MSITFNGVKLNNADKSKKGKAILAFLTLVEFIFTIFLTISLAAHILFPEQTEAVQGVSKILSYQGRLTDSSGNPLGGSGTNYCFRFSIYDSASGGIKLWPSGTPSNNIVNVANGVFNVGIGQADDLSTFDFSSNDTVYLQVEVANYSGSCGTYEALAPRQRIDATAYARVAAGVYGSALKTSSSNVQIGSGAGSATPIFLNLDVKNVSDTIGGSCSTNGALWYNSANSKALVCDNGTIRIVGSLGELAAIGVNASTPVSAGTVVFSNSNNVTFGLNGSTITASADAGVSGIAVSNSTTYTSGTVVLAAGPNITLSTSGQTISISGAAGGGGGGGLTLSNLSWPPGVVLTSVAQGQGSVSFGSLSLNANLTATRAAILASGSIASSVSGALSISIGIYTLNGSTLSLITDSSGSQTYSYTSNASSAVSGLRRISVPININMTPGQYYYGIRMSTANAGSFSIARGGGVTAAFSGNLGVASATSRQIAFGVGVTSSTALPASIAVTQIQAGGTAGLAGMPWILFTNLDAN